MGVSRERLSILIGSPGAFSRPVLIGLAVVGFLLSLNVIRLIPGQPLAISVLASAGAAALSVAVLFLARERGYRDGWNRPHPIVVIVGLVIASLIRSAATSLFVAWRTGIQDLGSGVVGRNVSGLLVTVVLGLIMVASAQLSRERAEANSDLLAEQARLRSLAENADAELVRSEAELRHRARELLEPTVREIHARISEEISEDDARQLSERINAAVNDVVRPASRELARSPVVEADRTLLEAQAPLDFLRDRVDITKAIRPGWLLIVPWGAMIPISLLLGVPLSDLRGAMVASLLAVVVAVGVKVLWPRRVRIMSIPVGLGVLLVVYCVLNLGLGYVSSNLFGGAESRVTEALNAAGWLTRVALAMLVSVLAILHVQGEQFRDSLRATNIQLEELVARIRRETWLMHRSVSLAVHGTVQSALISTAMRLTAAHRQPATVLDARRRLEDALTAITADQSHGASIAVALADLQSLWTPIVAVSHEMTPPAAQRLTDDSGLSRCVIEICREAASNAIRHGKARGVDIRIGIVGDLVEVRIADDGDGASSNASAGLGSQMLDETCLRWRLEGRPVGGSELIALLA